MASAFTHSLVGFTIGKVFPKAVNTTKILLIGMACAAMPDLDVFMKHIGFEYGHIMGHRGFTHTALFGFAFGLIIFKLFFWKTSLFSWKGFWIFFFFSCCTVSHGLLDMLTSGGYGIPLLYPFEEHRYFFPYRPILVSPMSIGRFFSEWGWRVIKSEAFWVGIPCVVILLFNYLIKRVIFKKKNA